LALLEDGLLDPPGTKPTVKGLDRYQHTRGGDADL